LLLFFYFHTGFGSALMLWRMERSQLRRLSDSHSSDALPYGRLCNAEPIAVSDAIGYAQLRRWFGIPCVLAIPPWPRLLHAQAREEEAETL
jgi:hypothetical protein